MVLTLTITRSGYSEFGPDAYLRYIFDVNKPVRLVIADDADIALRAIVQVVADCCEA